MSSRAKGKTMKYVWVNTRSFAFSAVYEHSTCDARIRADFVRAWRRHCEEYCIAFDRERCSSLEQDLIIIRIPVNKWLRDYEPV